MISIFPSLPLPRQMGVKGNILYGVMWYGNHRYFTVSFPLLVHLQGRIQANATDAPASVKKFASTIFGQLSSK